MPEVAALDPERVIKVLARHRVKFVMIGALAARMYGFPRLTADLDITPAADEKNLEKLAAALRDLDARVYTESIPEGLQFDCSARTLGRARMWNLVTNAGRVDIAFEPSGTTGYNDLVENAQRFEAFGTHFMVASMGDIIRSKESTGRARDREDVLLLRAIESRAKKAVIKR
ncbi:MAG TPA: hypothetical protein VJ865_16270 [Gemmatimonadaceae bacterium]|nr:hypothetical protein [Gemmatimonadaceae bacterium]